MNKEEVVALADYVLQTRTKKGLSLLDVERKSGGHIAGSYVSRIENGLVDAEGISTGKLKALATGLDEPEEEVFAIVRGIPPGSDAFANSEIAALFYDYKNLTDKDKRELQAVWDFLKTEIRKRKR